MAAPRPTRPSRARVRSGRSDREEEPAGAAEGRAPHLGILVDIDHAYPQCGEALIRSSLWDPTRFARRDEFPSFGRIMADSHGPDFDACAYDAAQAERYARREGFY